MSRTAHCLTVLAALAACAAGATAGAATLSTPSGEPPSMKVHYADLDLESAQGVATLYHRITVAASEVCPQVDPRVLHTIRPAHVCQQAAIARAVASIGNPMLARVAVDHGVSND
jgi:UrcA family protein